MRPFLRATCLLAALVLLVAACSGGDSAAPGEGSLADVPGLVDDVSPSIVAILVEAEQQSGEGSGVIWDDEGAVVTNNHVVEGANEITVVLATGERLGASLVGTDPRTDLAVLRVDRNGLPPASFAEDVPDLGELAIAFGNPLGFEGSITVGVVSGVGRAIPSGGQTPALVDLIQTDASISPGNSGGALVDAEGIVVGITVAYIPPQAGAVALGFAVPSPTVTSVVEQLLAGEEVEHAFLGVSVQPLTEALAERFGLSVDEGLVVVEVTTSSPAAEAGVQPEDVLVEAGGTPLRTVEDLLTRLRDAAPGDELTLTVVRDGEERTVTATLAQRPSG